MSPVPWSRRRRTLRSRSSGGRRALAWGLALAAVYVVAVGAGAWFHAGPAVPLLDGFAPPVAYRWVSPPSVLAPGNRPPEPQRFTVTIGKRGSDAQVISTTDLQATIVLGPAAIPPRAGSSSVQLAVTPLAPSSVGPLPSDLVVAGNVYRISASYEGDGAVGPLRRPAPVTLVYPALPIPTAQHITHQLVWSGDGRTWKLLQTRDSRQGQLAEAPVESLGYVAVGIPASAADGLVQSPGATPSGSPGSVGSKGFPFLAIAVAGLLAVIALVLVARRRSYRGSHR
jgi:hypothetical protein